MFKSKGRHVQQSQVEKFTRYSIRKVSFGAASVAVATGLFFLGGGSVQAAEPVINSEPTEVQNSQNLTDKSSEPSKEVTGQASATAKETDGQNNTSLKESDTDTQASAVETPNVVTEKVTINTAYLEDLVAKVESRLSQLTEGKKTKSVIDDAKNLVHKVKELLDDDAKTQAKVDALATQLSSNLSILNSIKSDTTEEDKVNKNQDPRNGKEIPGKGESGFREATTANPIIPAKEGPTNNNKLGSGNNPADGVFESAKDQFGDVDFTNSTEKSTKVEKQWSKSILSDKTGKATTQLLTGGITYNWKEKEISNEINGWKITDANGNAGKVTAIKPEAAVADAGREAEYQGKPSKVYDNQGTIKRNYNNPDNPTATNPLGVHAANQNYGNGVNYSGNVGIHNLPKGYYLELGEKGTKLSKEYAVNGNSRLMLSTITGGAYGNMGTAGTGERIKITMYDAVTGEKISSIRDDHTIGEKYESEHISAPSGDGGNGDGWTEYRAIYEVPQSTTRVRVEIEALDDGTAINNSYLAGTNSKVKDGYFVGAVNLAVGSGTEMTTNVKTNGKEGKFGEDNLYKSKQKGELEFTVNSVGGIRHYGSAETEIEVPEGVVLPENITNPTGNVWFGNVPVSAKNIIWDPQTRKLKLRYNTSKFNNGVGPYIGVGSNDGSRLFRLPFTTTDNYRGTATFKVRTYLPNGLRDGKDNQLLNTGDVSNADGKYHPVVNGLRNTDQPDYYYNKTIYIDTKRPDTPTVEAVHTDSIRGEKKDENQVKELLVSVPTKNTDLTNEAREKKDVAENDKNNGVDRAHTAGAETVDKAVDKIGAAIGGLTSMKVTLPNSKTPITLNKKEDGWYIGTTKVEERDGKLVVPVPKGTDLTEANETTNPDKRIKVTVLDKADNESDPAYANVLNEAPTVAVEKKDLYVYKTKEADKWNNEKVLEKAKPSATDLEDDRDGVDSTKPTIAVSDAGNLDTTKVGDYTVKVQSTDSEGKQSTETTVTVHVLDLIKVDPTVTTDPTNPSTKAPVSPKTADTPVKEGDENLGKYPAGVTREDLVKEVTRTIKYLKEEDADKADAMGLKPEKVQKVTYKRTATVNPETKEVTYSDWEVYKEADKLTDATADGTKGKFNAVESPVVENYLLVNAIDKTVAENEAPVPGEDGTVTPEVTKVLYKEIGSFVPNYPEGKKPNGAQDKIPYPNNLNDPTVPGDFSTITIPYVPGYTPVYNGQELTPKNPNDPTQGYKVPDGFTPTDKFGESPITYTPSTQTAKVVIEKKVDGAVNEVVSSFDLTGKSGSELPANTDIDNKIKELKNQGYEVESDEYHIQDNHHPTFDDKEDINAQDGTSAPSQTFKIVVKPRIVEVPSSTPHEKDSPVDPNGENPDLKWPEGLAESDLNTTAKRVISYVKKESDTATEEKAKDDTVQTVPFTRKATVNLVTKKVTYTDWESPNKTWDKVEVKTLTGYIADKKEIPAKEVATPAKDTKVIPDETDKVTYTKIGSWIPVDPTTGKDGDPIPFPNDPNDPTKTGEITQIIPHKDGYTPKDGNGTPLEPVNPANPEQGYKPPKITDPKANIKITYDKDDQKAKVKFVSVDPKTQTETELTDHALTITGKSGETISESDVQTHIDVLKSMGYDIVDNPFDKDPVFDTKKDTNENITQEFTIKVQPRVSTTTQVYVVEGDKPSAEKVGGAVTPGKDGKVTNPDVSNISTDGKAGQEIKVPVTVTYGADKFKRDEPVEVTVKVLPKPAPKGVTVLNGTSNEKLIDAIRENVNKAITGLTNVPEGVTPFVTDDAIVTPKTDQNGQQTPVTVTVKYRDKATGKVIDDVSVNVDVPVNVVGSTPKSKVVFEGDELTAKDITDAVTPGEKGTKGEPKDLAKDITAKPGVKEVTVPVTYTDQNGETLTEPVKVKVTVLPKPTPKGIFVAKDSDKEKAKEKALAKAKEAIADGIFKGKLPENVTNVSIDENVDNPDLSDDTDVNVTVKYTVDGEEKRTVVKVPVTVVEGVPQIVPVDENNKQPNPENSIDKTEYPEGSTFEYDPKTPVNTTTPGDYPVNVIVKDKEGNPIAEVPATVRVVESYPQFVPVDKDKKQPSVEGSIDPKAFPKDTEFSYETPVDTTTPGEKDVVVVAKIGDKVIAKIPAKVMVVEPKTQYVPVDKSNKQPDASKSIDPEQYPDGVTFKYKTPVDTTTPGEKDVIVEAKDGEDKLVEVPAKVKVVEGKEQLIPVNPTEKPQARDSITPSDYPEGSTFEYKVPEGQTEPFDATTVGDKPVTVIVKDKNGNVLVEVPATIKVVEAKPTPIETPVTNTPLTKEDIAKYVKVPEGGKVTNVENIPDLTTLGKKDPVKVTVELPNGKTIAVDVPVNVTPVKEIETPVTNTPLTPEDYTKGIKIPEGGKVTNVENIPDLTTPGQKDPVKVTVELPNGKVITVDVPVNVTPVNGIETPVTKTPLTPEDYTKGIKIPEGGKITNVENIPDLTTPGKKDPVKVTVELPNGKVITVDVPVNVTPVKGIETPVTNTPLTPEDYTKGITIPEGGKVTGVTNIPDLTTPGNKAPVKVTVELPNGKTITVDVPVNVTPATGIETPVTDTPLTKEDIGKHVKVPEGGKIVEVGKIPEVNTPGDKGTVKVKIELPNGKQIEVEVPVKVTPIKDIVKKLGDPITNEDVEKHIQIPEGGKIISIGDKPSTDIPGERPSVPVVIELPGGKRVTIKVPVIVIPKTTPIVVEVGTPVTPEDVQKHIELPNGWKVTKVGEIPTTTTPGTKPVVPVEIELPDGRKITVDVPVIVTPTVRQIVVPQGTPITPDDVKGHIDLPKEPGWEIIEVGEIPTTIPAGVKPSVKVKIKVPTGEIIEVEVPIIVTPTVTPIVVEVGTPITKEDVIKKVGLPEGWEIVEVGEIPTTETPGTKPVVKVKVKLPDGRIITVDVPVTVTPKSQNGGGVIAQNGGSTVQIVTEYLDENGNRITSDKEGKHNPIELEGYEYSHSTTDANGNTLHHYKKVTNPINQEQPGAPETPTSPEKPVATPVQTSSTESKQVAETTISNDKKELPNTGTDDKNILSSLGLLGMLGAFGLVARKKKED